MAFSPSVAPTRYAVHVTCLHVPVDPGAALRESVRRLLVALTVQVHIDRERRFWADRNPRNQSQRSQVVPKGALTTG